MVNDVLVYSHPVCRGTLTTFEVIATAISCVLDVLLHEKLHLMRLSCYCWSVVDYHRILMSLMFRNKFFILLHKHCCCCI